jgi:hypothetical protein
MDNESSSGLHTFEEFGNWDGLRQENVNNGIMCVLLGRSSDPEVSFCWWLNNREQIACAVSGTGLENLPRPAGSLRGFMYLNLKKGEPTLSRYCTSGIYIETSE